MTISPQTVQTAVLMGKFIWIVMKQVKAMNSPMPLPNVWNAVAFPLDSDLTITNSDCKGKIKNDLLWLRDFHGLHFYSLKMISKLISDYKEFSK